MRNHVQKNSIITQSVTHWHNIKQLTWSTSREHQSARMSEIRNSMAVYNNLRSWALKG